MKNSELIEHIEEKYDVKSIQYNSLSLWLELRNRIFTAISLVNGLKEIIGVDFDPLLLIDFVLAGGLIGLGFYLNSKMTSDYKTVKEKYTNQKDEEKLKFLDEINEFVEGIQKKYEQA